MTRGDRARRSSRRAVAYATLSLAHIITLGACAPGPATTERSVAPGTLTLGPLIDRRGPIGEGVVVLGDSLTDQSRVAIATELPGAVIDAFPGRTVARKVQADTAVERVEALKASKPTWWVLALGTNDGANAVLPTDDMHTDVRAILDAIGRDQCVLWVLPAVAKPLSDERIVGADRFALVAVDEISQLPCHAVVHWSETIRAQPDVLGPDGEHFTDAGEVRFARVIADALLTARGAA